MIYVDSNVPIYLVGAPHAHKTDSQMILERLIANGERLVTDVEVLQEILHRYSAIGRRDSIDETFQIILGLVDEVLPVDKADVVRAAQIALKQAMFSARDSLHLAVMERHNISSVFKFDADFDRWPGLTRIHRV